MSPFLSADAYIPEDISPNTFSHQPIQRIQSTQSQIQHSPLPTLDLHQQGSTFSEDQQNLFEFLRRPLPQSYRCTPNNTANYSTIHNDISRPRAQDFFEDSPIHMDALNPLHETVILNFQ